MPSKHRPPLTHVKEKGEWGEIAFQAKALALLVKSEEDFPFSSANPGFELDDIPQRLKPGAVGERQTHRA